MQGIQQTSQMSQTGHIFNVINKIKHVNKST